MRKLIVTTSDSGAGVLKAARVADKVIGLYYSLVDGPAPQSSDPIEFFKERLNLSVFAEDWEEELEAEAIVSWRDIRDCADEADLVEIWADPDPNAQLQVLQLLAAWKACNIEHPLAIFQATSRLSEHTPEEISGWRVQPRQVTGDQFEVAECLWSAYCQPTPDAWHRLIRIEDLSRFPMLNRAGLLLLAELPALDTGLIHSQTLMLTSIHGGASTPRDLLASRSYTEAPSGYWAYGRLLDELATCNVPAISGLQGGPFSLAMHDDPSRFAAYNRSALRLTEFGEALLSGEADFSTLNSVNRWWGGTHLTNANLWRWDTNLAAVAPPV
jgi:hypothetical protein